MDVAASVVALVTVLLQSTKITIELIDKWQDAPKLVRRVRRECVLLGAVLEDVKKAQYFGVGEDGSSPGVSSALSDHLEEAIKVKEELDDFIKGLLLPEIGNSIRVKRLRTMLGNKKIQKLQSDIGELKDSLAPLLVVQMMSNMDQMGKLMQHNHIALLARIQEGRSYTGAIIEHVPGESVPPQSGHQMNAATDGASHTNIMSPNITSVTNRMPPPDLASLNYRLSLSSQHDTYLSNLQFTKADPAYQQKTVSNLIAEAVASKRYCKCQCHRLRTLSTPNVLTWSLGRVVFAFSGQTSSAPQCDLATCDDQSRVTITITYYLPSWWMARAVVFRFIQSPMGVPKFSVVTRDLLPEHSPMLTAIANGNITHLRKLFRPESGLPECSPNAMETCGWTGLTWAIHMNQVTALQFLIDSGADKALEDGFGNTAIDYAWIAVFEKQVNPATIDYLRNVFLHGSKDELDKYEFTDLHRIVLEMRSGELEDMLYDMPRSQVNTADNFGKTALLWAARRGDLKTVKSLLRHGADPNISDQMRRSPLHMAARAKSVEVIKELIKFEADPIADNFINEKPAHYAAYEPNGIELLKPFLTHGMDINRPSKFGRTLLDIAVYSDRPDTVQYLIEQGANRDGYDKTEIELVPLGRAICFRFHEVARVLLELGVDRNRVDGSGNTYLHLLASKGSVDTLQLFDNIEFECWLPHVINNERKRAVDLVGERNDLGDKETQFLEIFSALMDRISSDDNPPEQVVSMTVGNTKQAVTTACVVDSGGLVRSKQSG